MLKKKRIMMTQFILMIVLVIMSLKSMAGVIAMLKVVIVKEDGKSE